MSAGNALKRGESVRIAQLLSSLARKVFLASSKTDEKPRQSDEKQIENPRTLLFVRTLLVFASLDFAELRQTPLGGEQALPEGLQPRA